jgi:hypothetical protein
MRHKAAFSCSELLTRANPPILERARRLSRLEQAVLELIPTELVGHCKVLNLKSEILVLATSSPAWAGRLRFAAPELIRTLKSRFDLNIRSVDLRIQPEFVDNQPVNKHRPTLSMRSAILVAQTAQGINHPPLREALYRLAAKTRSD